MVNTKHDTSCYDRSCYQREIFDGNVLYDAYNRAKAGSDWKPQVQQFEMNYLSELARIQREVMERNYKFSPTTDFVLHERGKVRPIHGEQMRDRVVKHALCDEVLTPATRKYLIYDNGASLSGKGITFTRDRLLTHLRKYYRARGNNDGYVLLLDFSKYYDNIRHDALMELFERYVRDSTARWLLQKTVEQSRVDVSYMCDEEYAHCMETLFNSLDHFMVDRKLLTGEKYMAKHLNIGDQVAQSAGIVYPMRIDNYVKIVRSVKFYGRYMDDSYVLHPSKEYLQGLLRDITRIGAELGIAVNLRKTRICKLSSAWRYLQVQYSLTETGRVIRKINPKRLTTMRRKLKKLAEALTRQELHDLFYGWFDNHYKLMSKRQRTNMVELYEKLKEETKDDLHDYPCERQETDRPRQERQ